MTDQTAPASPPRASTGARLLSFTTATLFGPPLAGALLGLWLAMMELMRSSSLSAGKLIAMPLQMALLAIPFGIPFAVPPALIGFLAFRRRARVPLWGFLLVALSGVILQFWYFGMVPEGSTLVGPRDILERFTRFAGPFLIPALISAALCWHLTRSWHSPEPDA